MYYLVPLNKNVTDHRVLTHSEADLLKCLLATYKNLQTTFFTCVQQQKFGLDASSYQEEKHSFKTKMTITYLETVCNIENSTT